MKQLIALATLMAITGAWAQSTSTVSITQKKKTFFENLSYIYWSDMRTGTLDENVRNNEPDTSMYNLMMVRYTFNPKDRLNFQVRFSVNDTNDENGKGDRFVEDDARITYQRLLFRNKNTMIRATMGLQFPTSRGSQADEDRILRLKPNLIISHKIDDYNSLLVVPGYTRTLYTRGQSATDEIERFYFSSWVMYTNKYFSDKYVARIDLETSHRHMPGYADTYLKTGAFNVVAGVDMNIAKWSIFPYVVHNTMGVKAIDQLGGGLQFFKIF